MYSSSRYMGSGMFSSSRYRGAGMFSNSRYMEVGMFSNSRDREAGMLRNVQDTWEQECSAIQETGELGCLAVQDEWEDECSEVQEWEFSAARDEGVGKFRSSARVGAGAALPTGLSTEFTELIEYQGQLSTEQSHLNGSKGMLRCQKTFLPFSSLYVRATYDHNILLRK